MPLRTGTTASLVALVLMLGLVSDARLETATVVVWSQGDAALPDGFVRLGDAISGIVLDVRYHGVNNFVGAPVDGYDAPTAILSQPATTALRRVQTSLRACGFGLKVFDAYRPQTAVDHFVRWAADLSDDRTKAEYYPDVPKSELFTRGYIAAASGHSRGSTVDLTAVRLADGAELDMGTPFDFFGAESAVDYQGLTMPSAPTAAYSPPPCRPTASSHTRRNGGTIPLQMSRILKPISASGAVAASPAARLRGTARARQGSSWRIPCGSTHVWAA